MSEQINPGPGWRLATEADVGREDVQFYDYFNTDKTPMLASYTLPTRLNAIIDGRFRAEVRIDGNWQGGATWRYARVRDTATIALKPGTWYRTAAGNKWFFVGLNQDGDYVMSVGEAAWTIGKDIDLVGWSEWREPRTWEVEVWVYVKPDGSRTFSLVELKGEVLAKKRIVETLTEGEGL